MLAAPERSMNVVPDALTPKFGVLGAVNVTPVVEHEPVPPEPVIVPFWLTETSRTVNALGLFTRRITSAVLPPGSNRDPGASPPANAVTVTGCREPVVPPPVPEPAERK